MTGIRQQRLPLEPLMAAARANHSELAEIVRRPRQSILRYATEGIPLLAADQMACRLGMHPSAVWPEWFDLALAVPA